jgi:hypothetical protein
VIGGTKAVVVAERSVQRTRDEEMSDGIFILIYLIAYEFTSM